MIRSYRFLLHVSKKQREDLFNLLRLLRHFYNACLQERIEAWKKQGIKITKYDQYKSITELKNTCEEYANIHTHLLQELVERLENAFQAFFDRIKKGQKPGFPRFKSEGKFNSFKFKDAGDNNGTAIVIENKDNKFIAHKQARDPKEVVPLSLVSGKKRLRISGIGNIKIKLHRDMEGCLKTICVVHDNGKFYAVFTRDKIERIPKKKTGKEIGADVGISSFVTYSDGVKVGNQHHLRNHERNINRLQNKLSGQVKGSKRYETIRYQLANEYKHLANCRKDFIHKESRKIANNYDLVSIENLNIPQMVQSGNLAKEILDAGWGSFAEKLAYKVEETGGEFVKVDPAYTSQDCSGCGFRDPIRKTLSDRVHNCKECGLVLDRDHNAAINILQRGKEKLEKEKLEKLREPKKLLARTKPSRIKSKDFI